MDNPTPQLPLFTIVADDLPPTVPITRRQVKDLTGQKFGRQIVLGFVGINQYAQAMWLCQCECGKKHVVNRSSLVGGYSRSCGCLTHDILMDRNTTHGMYGVPEYKCWRSMINRCERPDDEFYHRYGGRGIAVCDRWRDSIENFIEDMGPRPSSAHTIDRIDNDLGYFPENCRWATRREQATNTSRNHFLEFQGERLTIVEWSERTGILPVTILSRINANWSIERALTTPVKHY